MENKLTVSRNGYESKGQWIGTKNKELAICISATSAAANSRKGETLKIDGRDYIVDRIGNQFKVDPRDHRVYVYITAAILA